MKFFHRLRPLLPAALLNLVFIGSSLFWIFRIPYNDAPDENNHFRYSVEFIMENRRLPVLGADDAECFRNATSSYNQFPALNYILAALAGGAARSSLGLAPYTGARLFSLFCGLIFVNCLLAAAWRCAGGPVAATVTAAIAALVPQVIFVCSYVNADAYALGVSGMLALSAMRVLRPTTPANGPDVPTSGSCDREQEKSLPPAARSSSSALRGEGPECRRPGVGGGEAIGWADALFFGTSIGLLFTAKLNFWIYLPWMGIGALGLMIAKRLSWQDTRRLVSASVLMTLLLGAGWYWRNFTLYGSMLPGIPTPEWLAGIGVENPPPRAVIGPRVSWPALQELVRRGFFMHTLEYFYGRFGYGTIGFDPRLYAILKFLAPALFVLFAAAAVGQRDRAVSFGLLWLIGLAASNLFFLILYAVTIDYQPQGRYLFPLLAPAAAWMAWSIGRHPRLLKYAVPLLLLHAWLLYEAHVLLWHAYA